MMTSPESYYEMYLKGKTEKEILTVIRRLKNEIGHLKNVMENPQYQSIVCPSEDVQLQCTRLYLEEAKKALIEVDGVYKPSQAELKAQAFDNNISDIKEIELSIGGYFGGYSTYKIDLTNNDIKILFIPPIISEEESKFIQPQNDKTTFIEQLRDLNIGEWHNRYVNQNILDGTQWHLNFYYNNKRSVKYYGSNAYPYNFKKLCNLFEI